MSQKRYAPSQWKRYDPAWLIEFAKKHCPDEGWLVAALTKCTSYAEESPAYYHFVDPIHPNQPGSAWQYRGNLWLIHPQEGSIILDILTDHRIGGIEFLDRL